MKKLKFMTILLAMGFILGACSTNTTETSVRDRSGETTATRTETTEAEKEETETEPTMLNEELLEEDDAPSWDDMKEEKMVISNEPLLGFNNWYVLKRVNAYNYAEWIFYTEDDIEFGIQFGCSTEEPEIKIRDLDGDGVTELICMNLFTGDGAHRIHIYRNNNGVIEEGTCEQDRLMELYGFDELCVMAYDEIYNYDKDRMELIPYYEEDNTPVELTLEAFTFGEFITDWGSIEDELKEALGYNEIYCTYKTNNYGKTCWDFSAFNVESFAFINGYGNGSELNISIIDVDGDGVKEVVCKTPVEKDGPIHTFIIRKNDKKIEVGSSDKDLDVKEGMGFEGFTFE